MFHLESRISEWRSTMQAAGVTDQAVLRELESHLREDFLRIMESSSAAEPAFAEAVANLGQPGEIKQEFDRAVIAPRGRILRLLFPTNLRYHALIALPLAPWLLILGVIRLSGLHLTPYIEMRLSVFALSSNTVEAFWGILREFLGLVVTPLLGIQGLVAAVLYLRRPSQRWALHLAGFQCFFGGWWVYGVIRGILRFQFGVPLGGFRLWGLHYDPFNIGPFSLTAIVLGSMAFYFWRRELLGPAGSRKNGRSTAALV